MQINDSPGDGVVGDLVTVVHQDEEQVEPAHDRSSHVDVLLQTLASVVASSIRVGRGQYTRPDNDNKVILITISPL